MQSSLPNMLLNLAARYWADVSAMAQLAPVITNDQTWPPGRKKPGLPEQILLDFNPASIYPGRVDTRI